MISVKDIIDGHVKEFFSINDEISENRMKICHKCPIFSKAFGGLCNSKLWLDPDTDEVSTTKKPGYIKGCGCRLEAKTRVPEAFCIAGKW